MGSHVNCWGDVAVARQRFWLRLAGPAIPALPSYKISLLETERSNRAVFDAGRGHPGVDAVLDPDRLRLVTSDLVGEDVMRLTYVPA